MYLAHFNLNEFPFSITPDTDFYFASQSYQEALNTLLIAVGSGEGFIKITGEVGTGKTLLCRKLMNSLGPEYKLAYIPNPYLEPRSLLLMLASELGIDAAGASSQHELLHALNLGLLNFAKCNMRVVVCLDEVQAMPTETLEALRLLSNLETEKRKLLQVVIFGQPELEDKLNHPSVRQLKQRITFEYQLGRLSRDELQFYLNHRLHVAGYQGGRVFTATSLRLLYATSKGIPRLVNILAHKALLAAYGKGLLEVTVHEMAAAVSDTKAAASVWTRPTFAHFKLLVMLCVAGVAMLMPI